MYSCFAFVVIIIQHRDNRRSQGALGAIVPQESKIGRAFAATSRVSGPLSASKIHLRSGTPLGELTALLQTSLAGGEGVRCPLLKNPSPALGLKSPPKTSSWLRLCIKLRVSYTNGTTCLSSQRTLPTPSFTTHTVAYEMKAGDIVS